MSYEYQKQIENHRFWLNIACVSLSLLLKGVFFLCVTAAAFHFQKDSILWWYFLALLMGYEVRTETKIHKDGENG